MKGGSELAYCKVRQAEIYYEEIGDGIPILLIHGFTPDHRLMSGCMEPIFTLRKGWRRIYVDLPGMGLTKNYDEISNSDDILSTLIDFIEAVLPNQEYIIAGESYGGYLARGLIKKHKDRVLGVAFICPVIIPNQSERTIEKHKVLKRDNEFLKKISEVELTDFSSNQVVLNEYNWLRYNKEIIAGCKIADAQFLEKIKNNYAFSFELENTNYTKPSLFILGRQDASVGYKDALNIMEYYPRGSVAILDIAGHNLQIEQPELFNCLVNEWLDRTENYIKLDAID